MRKFVSNYLITNTGAFLKNGIAIVGEDGFIDQYIDTTGDLRELEQLIFYNGILMAGFYFVKSAVNQPITSVDNTVRSMVLQSVGESTLWSIHEHIELGKSVQGRYPQLTIPFILNELTGVLLTEGKFVKQTIPGIYLLTGVNLADLHFKPNSRLKKII